MITSRELQEHIAYGRKKKAAIEIYFQEQQEDSVSVRHKEIEQVQSSIDRGLGVRVIVDNRFGFSYTSSLLQADIRQTIDQAIANAECAMRDPYLKLPKKAISKASSALNLFDAKIAALTAEDRVKYALAAENSAYAYDKRVKKTDASTFSSGVSQSILLNSHGIALTQKASWAGLSLEIIAEEGAIMEAAYDYQYATHLKGLSAETVGRNAAELAIIALSSGDVATGVYDLVFPPRVAVSLLSVISSLFSADMVQKKKSLFRGKLDKTVASSLITITDNPLLPKQLGSFLYDGEGVPGKEKELIHRGILKNYLFDTYTASKAKTKSTGNGIRGSIKAEPMVGPSNLYITTGTTPQRELIAGVKKGVLIHSLMGLHTADPVSGDFSLGATGQLIENGKITRAVKNMAVAGNLIEVLKSITAVGSDLEFRGSLGSPTLVVSGISVAGNGLI